MPYGRCGRCHTNFARATPTYCPFVIIGYTNFDLLVTHIMFWPHQLWKPFSAHANITIDDIPFKRYSEVSYFLEGMNEAVVQTNIYFVLQQIILMNLRRSDFVWSKIY